MRLTFIALWSLMLIGASAAEPVPPQQAPQQAQQAQQQPIVVHAADPGSGGWQFAAVGLVGTCMGYLFSYLKDRDKLMFDKKLVDQGAEISTLRGEVAHCQAEHKTCQQATERLSREVTELRHRDDKDRKELEAKIAEITGSNHD